MMMMMKMTKMTIVMMKRRKWPWSLDRAGADLSSGLNQTAHRKRKWTAESVGSGVESG